MYAKRCLPASGNPMQLYGCLCIPVGYRSSHLLLQVVFKALIVLHTMIRNGATDNVLAYLSSSDVLRLKNISAGVQWEGKLPFSSTLAFQLRLLSPKVTLHLKTFRITLYTSTRGLEPIATSNMMPSVSNPNPTVTCGTLLQSRRTSKRNTMRRSGLVAGKGGRPKKVHTQRQGLSGARLLRAGNYE